MIIKFTGNGLPVSFLIRARCQSKISHCEFVFSDDMVITPSLKIGQVIKFKNIKLFWEWEYIYKLDVTAEEEQTIRDWAESQIGVVYDFSGLTLNEKLIPRFKPNWKDSSAWICSEFCAAGLEKIGIKLFDDAWYRVTPEDLLKKIETSSFAKQRRNI